ncbi:MAG: hypothetical protein IPF49_00020 [Gammaproteobacteria bacterium]|nr:hypothetical protein [Gammaproteobacteria bacterium]
MGGPHGDRFTHARRHGGRSGGTVRDHRPWPADHRGGGFPHWTPVAGATGYAIYRHELPGGSFDLGLPLGEVEGRHGQLRGPARTRIAPLFLLGSTVARARGGAHLYHAGAAASPGDRDLEARYRGLVTEQGAAIGEDIRLVAHPLGTDYLGRDSPRAHHPGARTSLFIGVTAPFLYVLFGLCYGGVSGYFGGRIDNAMMRFADFVIALPFLLFMILFKVAFGIGPGESGVMPMLMH